MKHTQLMSRLSLLCVLMVTLLLSACTSDDTAEDIRHASLEDIHTVHIDHGSTPLTLEVADVDSLEASLLLPRGGEGIIVDESQKSLNIRLNSDISRLINLGKKPRLHVVIPASFERRVVVKGSSGSVTGRELRSHSLHIEGKSGGILLEYAELNQDLNVSVHSGNVRLRLADSEPDASWRLQSSSGRRSVAFPLDGQSEQKRRTEGTTGSGSVHVSIETKSGSITVE